MDSWEGVCTGLGNFVHDVAKVDVSALQWPCDYTLLMGDGTVFSVPCSYTLCPGICGAGSSDLDLYAGFWAGFSMAGWSL